MIYFDSFLLIAASRHCSSFKHCQTLLNSSRQTPFSSP